MLVSNMPSRTIGEYRYYDFGNEEIGEFENVDLDFNTVSIGVAYKF